VSLLSWASLGAPNLYGVLGVQGETLRRIAHEDTTTLIRIVTGCERASTGERTGGFYADSVLRSVTVTGALYPGTITRPTDATSLSRTLRIVERANTRWTSTLGDLLDVTIDLDDDGRGEASLTLMPDGPPVVGALHEVYRGGERLFRGHVAGIEEAGSDGCLRITLLDPASYALQRSGDSVSFSATTGPGVLREILGGMGCDIEITLPETEVFGAGSKVVEFKDAVRAVRLVCVGALAYQADGTYRALPSPTKTTAVYGLADALNDAPVSIDSGRLATVVYVSTDSESEVADEVHVTNLTLDDGTIYVRFQGSRVYERRIVHPSDEWAGHTVTETEVTTYDADGYVVRRVTGEVLTLAGAEKKRKTTTTETVLATVPGGTGRYVASETETVVEWWDTGYGDAVPSFPAFTSRTKTTARLGATDDGIRIVHSVTVTEGYSVDSETGAFVADETKRTNTWSTTIPTASSDSTTATTRTVGGVTARAEWLIGVAGEIVSEATAYGITGEAALRAYAAGALYEAVGCVALSLEVPLAAGTVPAPGEKIAWGNRVWLVEAVSLSASGDAATLDCVRPMEADEVGRVGRGDPQTAGEAVLGLVRAVGNRTNNARTAVVTRVLGNGRYTIRLVDSGSLRTARAGTAIPRALIPGDVVTALHPSNFPEGLFEIIELQDAAEGSTITVVSGDIPLWSPYDSGSPYETDPPVDVALFIPTAEPTGSAEEDAPLAGLSSVEEVEGGGEALLAMGAVMRATVGDEYDAGYAVVADWGDGASERLVLYPGDIPQEVLRIHRYATAGTYLAHVRTDMTEWFARLDWGDGSSPAAVELGDVPAVLTHSYADFYAVVSLTLEGTRTVRIATNESYSATLSAAAAGAATTIPLGSGAHEAKLSVSSSLEDASQDYLRVRYLDAAGAVLSETVVAIEAGMDAETLTYSFDAGRAVSSVVSVWPEEDRVDGVRVLVDGETSEDFAADGTTQTWTRSVTSGLTGRAYAVEYTYLRSGVSLTAAAPIRIDWGTGTAVSVPYAPGETVRYSHAYAEGTAEIVFSFGERRPLSVSVGATGGYAAIVGLEDGARTLAVPLTLGPVGKTASVLLSPFGGEILAAAAVRVRATPVLSNLRAVSETIREVLGYGDGVRTIYGTSVYPVEAEGWVVSVGGEAQTDEDCTQVAATGIVTFLAGHIPGGS